MAWPTAAVVPWPSSSASHPTAHSPRSGDPGGAALNLNVHIHALVLDGVFAPDGAGGVRFCPVEPMGADDVASLLTTIEGRIEKLLASRCVPVRRWGDAIDLPDPPPLGRWHARQHGFDLHAGIVVPAGARDRLERLCRYALRPPVGQDRLQLTPDGKAVLELRRRWTDGTTHLHPTAQETRGGDPGLVFEPVELLERLAALTPRPRINWVLYHGVLAPRSIWRKSIVPPVSIAGGAKGETEAAACADDSGPDGVRSCNRGWADLMQRSFGFDVLACPRCPGRLTLVALIRETAVILRILRHLGLPDEVPVMRPARDPPLPLDGDDDRQPSDY